MYNLDGQVAIVTGAASGIGRSIALRLSVEGASVVAADLDGKATEGLIQEVVKQGKGGLALKTDVSIEKDGQRMAEETLKNFGRIDILVNNAGSSPGGVLDFLTEEHWAQSLQLKFMGYVRCLKHVLPIMQKQGHGRVVNLIGNDGVKPSYWEIAPGAANAAGQNLTLALAGQYGKDNISFVAVNPGPVRTERWAGLVDAMARDMKIPREEADTLAPRSIPLGRIADCEEVASLVAYLASDLAHFINGTMIEIDGGQQKPLMDRFRDR